MIYTIGHSNHPMEAFGAMLDSFGIQTLADIRSVPQSRYNPQFGLDNLSVSLAIAQINYVPMKALGGMRQPVVDSVNTGLRSDGFRGYADYMQTAEFTEAIVRLIDLSVQSRTAIMCAEAAPSRCHRSLVSDALTVRCIEVIHILAIGQSEMHQLTSCAKIDGTGLQYKAEEDIQRSLF